jgi:hypothetical protein
VSQPKVYDYFVLVHQPKHPRAMGEGYVPEQYLIAEKELGRPLSPDEDIRHINGNTQDNRPANLEIISTNADYRVQGLVSDSDEKRVSSGNFMPCKFQRVCWKEVRAPIARKNKVYLPWICSFQTEGDVYKCSHFWGYVEKARREEEKE